MIMDLEKLLEKYEKILKYIFLYHKNLSHHVVT
jgi:hypothetical protein